MKCAVEVNEKKLSNYAAYYFIRNCIKYFIQILSLIKVSHSLKIGRSIGRVTHHTRYSTMKNIKFFLENSASIL